MSQTPASTSPTATSLSQGSLSSSLRQGPRFSLAWKDLAASKRRLVASTAGTAFAVTLMFMQTGFRNALMDSMVAVIEQLDGELFLVSRLQYTLTVPQPFPRRRLQQATSLSDVRSASPFYAETRLSRWKNPDDGIARRVRVLAYDPAADLLAVEDICRQRDRWGVKDTALADVLSKGIHGDFQLLPTSELSGKTVRVVGTFRLGTDFHTTGTLVVSEQTFLELFPSRYHDSWGSSGVDVGVLRLSQGRRCRAGQGGTTFQPAGRRRAAHQG